MLWESLTGKRLLAAKTQAAQLKMLLFDLLPPLHAVKPDLDPAIASICDRALARDVRNRYPSATAMRLDIERVLANGGPRRETLAAFIQPLFAQDRAEIESRIRSALSGNDTSQLITLDKPEPTPGYLSIEVIKEPTVAATPPALERIRPRRKVIGYISALATIAGALAALALFWGRGRTEADAATQPSVAAPSAQTHHPKPTLRLCGSNTVGAELAPMPLT